MNTASPTLEELHAQMQRRVFSLVAHDLKTPLACIIGSLEALNHMRDKLSQEQQATLITIALEQAQHLDTLFNTMLENAKPE